jgi:hypothetical protein
MNAKTRKIAVVIMVECLMAVTGANARAATEPTEELEGLYRQLIEAENRHDDAAVTAMVWKSPSTLFVAKAPIGWRGYWGVNDVLDHLHDVYQPPFRIEPKYEQERVVLLTPEIAETCVPVSITVAYAGQSPVPKPFVMVLLWIKTPQGWKMATDIPIPVPPERQ